MVPHLKAEGIFLCARDNSFIKCAVCGNAVNCPFARLTMSGERSHHVFIFFLFFAGPGSKDKRSSHKCIYEWINSPVSQHLSANGNLSWEMSFEVRAASITDTLGGSRLWDKSAQLQPQWNSRHTDSELKTFCNFCRLQILLSLST